MKNNGGSYKCSSYANFGVVSDRESRFQCIIYVESTGEVFKPVANKCGCRDGFMQAGGVCLRISDAPDINDTSFFFRNVKQITGQVDGTRPVKA